MRNQAQETPCRHVTREIHLLWGKTYLLEVEYADTKPHVTLDHKHIVLRVRSSSTHVQNARERLGARGVQVVERADGAALPFADASFELVTSRHPVRPDWVEIHRVLQPGGHYCAACGACLSL